MNLIITRALIIVWIMISGLLIISLWKNHHPAHFMKKGFWSIILCIPVIGWIFYGAFFTPPNNQSPADRATGHSSGWSYHGKW